MNQKSKILIEKIEICKQTKKYKWMKLPFVILKSFLQAYVLTATGFMTLALYSWITTKDSDYTNITKTATVTFEMDSLNMIRKGIIIVMLCSTVFVFLLLEIQTKSIYTYIKNNLMNNEK